MRRRQTYIASAHHESGHAVARVVLGIAGDVDRVSVHPDDLIGEDALGAVWGKSWIAPVCGRAVDHEAVRARIIGLLAGPAAEARFTGSDLTGCGGDVEMAWRWLSAAYLDTTETFAHEAIRKSMSLASTRDEIHRAHADLHRRILEHLAEAEAFVAEHWPAIEGLARRLARRKRLSGDEVRKIVLAAEAAGKAPPADGGSPLGP